MRIIILTLSFLLACSFTAIADETRPPVSKYVRAYTGEEGIQVWIARMGEPSKGEVLHQFAHIDHPWDLLIHKATVTGTERERRYSIKVDGNDYQVLVLGSGSGTVYLPHYAPNNKRSFNVSYDGSLSAQGNAQHMLTRYLAQ